MNDEKLLAACYDNKNLTLTLVNIHGLQGWDIIWERFD